MEGPSIHDEELAGVIPRTVREIFLTVAEAPDSVEFVIKVHMLHVGDSRSPCEGEGQGESGREGDGERKRGRRRENKRNREIHRDREGEKQRSEEKEGDTHTHRENTHM